MAINIETGEEAWRYNCPWSVGDIPLAVIDSPNFKIGRPEELVYVGAGKWIYCLKVYTGELLWTSRVSSAKFGTSYMTLATPWSSRLAAEVYSGFNQNPAIHQLDNIRQQEIYDRD
jgi:outer membrane protein assembly factor BamB